MTSLLDAARQLRAAIVSATAGLVGREQLAELIILSAVAGEHLLVIGPPGTGKSAVVRRVAQALGGRYFEYLLGRFTEPSELFGPVDLKKLREGTVETDVRGMLPEADIAFLDEIFLGSTAILNTLLGVLNERRFRRGHTQIDCPLQVCVAAANALPDEEGLAAFADRFLVHVFIEPVPDHQLEALLQGGWRAEAPVSGEAAGLLPLSQLSQRLREVDLDGVRPALAKAIRQLREAGVNLSDRRLVKAQRLMAAAALLAGRLRADESDLWPLLYVLPSKEAQTSAREVLQALLAQAAHPHLFSAVEEAVLQPMSRVARLGATAERLLEVAALGSGSGSDLAVHFVQPAEALLREIDANFGPGQVPEALQGWRERLVAQLATFRSGEA